MKSVSELFGPLKKYHADQDVFEFCVDAFDDVYVEKNGKIISDDKVFKNENEIHDLINNLLASVNRSVSPENPYADVRLADGTRIIACIPPMATRSANLLVRKPVVQDVNLETLKKWGALDERAGDLIKDALMTGKNIVLTGLAGTGKVTMLNAMISEMDPEWRVIVAEKNTEIQVQRKRLVSLETAHGRQDEYLDLVKKAYPMRADYMVGTRVEGQVAMTLLEYMRGETSVLAETTASGASDLLKRFEIFGLTSLSGIHREDLKLLISDAIDVVITMKKDEKTNKRFIEHIGLVKGLREDGKYDIESLYNGEPK